MRPRRWTPIQAAVLAGLVAVGLAVGVTRLQEDQKNAPLSREELRNHWQDLEWPPGYTQQEKIDVLEKLRAEMRRNLDAYRTLESAPLLNPENQRIERSITGMKRNFHALSEYLRTLKQRLTGLPVEQLTQSPERTHL